MGEPEDEGGSAFPAGVSPGMSLRDWLAGQALAGILAEGKLRHSVLTNLASDAYEMADAMLAERRR